MWLLHVIWKRWASQKILWEDPGITLLEVKADCLSEGQSAEWCPKICLAGTVIFKIWIPFSKNKNSLWGKRSHYYLFYQIACTLYIHMLFAWLTLKAEMVGWHHLFNGQELGQTLRWWGRGRSGVLQSTGSQRVRYNLATEQQQQLWRHLSFWHLPTL